MLIKDSPTSPPASFRRAFLMIFSVHGGLCGHEDICIFLGLKRWCKVQLDGVTQTETTSRAGSYKPGILAKVSYPHSGNTQPFLLALGYVSLAGE